MANTVNSLYDQSLTVSARVFVVRSVAALCGLLSALPIVVVAGRQRFERSSWRWTTLAAAVLAATVVGTVVEFATIIAVA
ncbi:MAG: hypothetical protein M3Z15_08615, partial [Pseudomonadota bacterium]|nr:hypothetical protein [Pseudomonadota bacterium]